MPPWGEVTAWALAALCLLAGVSFLLLALLHVRYTAAWGGAWGGTVLSPHGGFARLEFGFPGFMRRAWEWPPATQSGTLASPAQDPASSSAEGPEGTRAFDASAAAGRPHRHEGPPHAAPNEEKARKKPRPFKITARMRRAFFRLVTDGKAWKYLGRYFVRSLRGGARLLNLRVDMAAGHPDPVFLGRMAGYWYAVSPLLPLGNTTLDFRFQDRQPSFRLRVSGAFSLLSLLSFGILLFVTFPFIGLGRRAWHAWRRHALTGWREWAYRRLQA